MADDGIAIPDKAPESPASVARFWLDQIELAQKGKVASWHTRGDKIIRRYKDERDEGNSAMLPARHKMNLLWSNVETMKPTVYARTPKPNIQRRNKDRDPVGRWGCVTLERCVSYCLSAQDFDYTMRSAVSDLLLPGRGVVIEEYAPEFTEDGGDAVEWEKSKTRYIHWKDFLTNPARTWDEVWWVAYRTYETRTALEDFLIAKGETPEEAKRVVNAIVLDHTVENGDNGKSADDPTDEANRRATVWCVWSKRDRKVIYVAPGCGERPLAETEPPIKLDNFFPCPRPMLATVSTDSLIPVPDFAQYQDQADEIDLMTQRINLLQKALKITGVYDSRQSAIGQMLNDSNDNTLIPVDTWAAFAEKGGLKGSVDFFPIDIVAATLEKCIAAREASKQNLYEVTGISDIVRGASDAGETATAQQIKSQWGSLRIRDRQHEVQRFARDIVRIKCEVISETFSDDVIKRMSGVKLLTAAEKQQAQQLKQAAEAGDPQAQAIVQRVMAERPEMAQLIDEPTWDEVLALLRSDHLRGFSIDIETDSTINPDEMAERQAAVEFGTTIGGMLQAMAPILPSAPVLAPLFGELLTFTVRRFKVGETMETQIERAMEDLAKMLAQPKPDPAQAQAEAEMKLEQERIALEKEKAGAELALKREEIGGNMALKREELNANLQMKQAELVMSADMQRQKAETDFAIKREGIAAQNETKRAVEGIRADNAVEKDSVTGKTQQIVEGAVAQVGDTLGAALTSLADGMKALADAQAAQGADFKAGMGQLAGAMMAEQEIVRGPDGRAAGARRKPTAMVN